MIQISRIDPSHPLHGVVVATVEVFNAGGECRVRATDELKILAGSLDVGHYGLFDEGRASQFTDDQAIASITVMEERGELTYKLYSERLVPELPVGTHELVAMNHQTLKVEPEIAPRRPTP